MNRSDYLKLVLKNKTHLMKKWIISAFCVVNEGPDDYKQDPYPYRLVSLPTGKFFVDPDGTTLVNIEDSVVDQPLFDFLESITVDPSVCINLTEPIETKVGNVLVNEIAITPAFGDKVPFQNGKVNGEKIESFIASRLKDTPAENEVRDHNFIYVDELLKFNDALGFLRQLASISVWSATEKVLTPAPGIREYKQQLLKEYEGRLHDPVVLTEFEGKLKAYDAEYTKGDKSERGFLSGKVKDNARRKLFLCMGAEQTFSTSMHVTPVIASLDEGIPTDPEQFTAAWNGSRFGSYSRGSETVKGGVSAKVLLRALNNFKIIKGDCGTKLTRTKTFNSSDIHQLEGRYILENNKLVQVKKDRLQEFIGKPVQLRSIAFCKSDGEQACSVCAGERLAQNPEGISLAVTEISSIILTTSLKAMHSQVLSTGKYDINAALS